MTTPNTLPNFCHVYNPAIHLRIAEVRALCQAFFVTIGQRYTVVDVTRGSASGCDYEVQVIEHTSEMEYCEDGTEMGIRDYWKYIRTVAKSADLSFPNARNKIGGIGAYGPAFMIDSLPTELMQRRDTPGYVKALSRINR